jgi:DNA polymerase
VFGEGPEDAELALVGEQPGDQEDLAGRLFIVPAGEVIDAALAAAGIVRDRIYATNAVKHSRFLPRDERRLHQRPTADQVRACTPWLAAELGAIRPRVIVCLAAIRPRVIVCLGATAVQSLIGSRFSVTRDRGRPMTTAWGPFVATHHPAAVLRVDPARALRVGARGRPADSCPHGGRVIPGYSSCALMFCGLSALHPWYERCTTGVHDEGNRCGDVVYDRVLGRRSGRQGPDARGHEPSARHPCR